MKRILMSIIVLTALLCIGAADVPDETGKGKGGVLERQRTVLGTITSIDEETGNIAVLDEYKHYDVSVRLRKDLLSKVKVGDRVRVLLQPNTNVARMVLVLEPSEPEEAGRK